jgi:HSP20 family molecular chaperone IbpA
MEVESKGAEVKYDDGVLILTLPKHPNGKNHRITVM